MLSINNTQSTNLQHVISLSSQAAPEESLISTPNKQTPQKPTAIHRKKTNEQNLPPQTQQ